MFNVDTLFVISSSRGDYVLDDLVAAIDWSAGGSHFTLIVDETSTTEKLSVDGRYQIIHSDLGQQSSFHRAAGLKWAVESGVAYRQVVMLSDTCLITGKGIDTFFLPHTQKDHVGLIGVRTGRYVESLWSASQTKFFEWNLPIDQWERPPIALCNDVLIMSGRFVGAMYQHGLLVPAGCDQWMPGLRVYGAYASWVCHMLNLYVVSWGFETKPLPPLYVSHVQGQFMPPPHLLHDRVLLFSPATNVMGYSEGDLRELYKQQRGEISREVPKAQPQVTGPQTAN